MARAIEAASARGAKRAVSLPISVPAHSSLMLPAAERLRERLAATTVDAACRHRRLRSRRRGACEPDAIRAALVKQLRTPVYWAATVRTMIARRRDHIVECGPGKVLTSLNRRIDKNRDLKMLALEDPQVVRRGAAAAAADAGEEPTHVT